MNINKQNWICHRLFFTEVLLYLGTLLLMFCASKFLFAVHKPLSDSASIALYIPLFIFTLAFLGMHFFIEYKYYNLKFKNIFLYLGCLIALTNLIAVCSLPNTISLPNNASMTLSVSTRIYSIIYGFVIGLMPFVFFYLMPRKINHKKYLIFVVFLFLMVSFIFCFISFFKDFNNILITIKSKFTDMNHPALSIFMQKNIFGRILFVGICAAIFMDILTNKHYWLLFIIPLLFIEIFTFAKMPIFISILAIASYFIVKLIFFMKKTKDNLFISILCISFVLIVGSIFAVLISNSSTGLLFSIKNAFVNFGNSAKETFTSRMVIWDCTIKILKPLQYVIGFGMVPVSDAIHFVYENDSRRIESADLIYHSHNGFIEALAEGGIIFVLINLFLLVTIIYMAIKNYKYDRQFSIFVLIIVLCGLILSSVEPIIFFNEGDVLYILAIIVWPIASQYYCHNKVEQKNRQYLLMLAGKITYLKSDNKMVHLIKKKVKYDSLCLKNDINK